MDVKQFESPLANLVRRTSARRRKQPQTGQYAYYPSQNPPTNLYLDIERVHNNITTTTPHSPLLHSHFARDSVDTASSYDDTPVIRSSTVSRDIYGDHLRDDNDHSDYGYRYFEDDVDDRNVYFGATSLRDSWGSTDTLRDPESTRHLSDSLRPSQERYPQQVEGPPPPSVFVSLRDADATTIGVERTPVVRPVINFSRPIREVGHPQHAGERVTPQLPPDMREQKLKVLERNAKRGMARSSSPMVPLSPFAQTSMHRVGSLNGSSSGTPSL